MIEINMKQMLEAGVHFGHQTRRWDPKMKPYIFGKRNGIYIVDLRKTEQLFREAAEYVQWLGSQGRSLLFVGTKRQAREAVEEEAKRCGQYFVTNRWLGGTLTNFVTIRASIERLEDTERRLDDEESPLLKKERVRLERDLEKMRRNLEGIREMRRLPDALFVIDPSRESIAISEANKLGIPVIAVVDTNCNPELVDFVIPGNDDAIRSIRLFTSRIADAYLQGARELETEEQIESEGEEAGVIEKLVEKPEKVDKAKKAKKVEKPEQLEKAKKVEKPEQLEKAEASSAAQESAAATAEEASSPEAAEEVAEGGEPEEVEEPEAETKVE